MNPAQEVEEYCRHGESLFALQDWEGALHAFQEALKKDPRSAVAHNDLGVLLGQQGDLRGAMEHLGQAIALDPHHRGAVRNLGDLLVAMNQTELASDLYSRYLKSHPGDQEIRNSLGGLMAPDPAPGLVTQPPIVRIPAKEAVAYEGKQRQDIFVDQILDRDRGYFVDIGAYRPRYANNSYFFEKSRGWQGLAFEIQDFRQDWKSTRACKFFCEDVTQTDFRKIFAEEGTPEVVDYLFS